MSYMQCGKCGGSFGMIGSQVIHCDCPAVPAAMVADLEEAFANNQTINETTNWAGVCVDLIKKGYKK